MNLHLTPEMRQMSVYHLCYCLQSLCFCYAKTSSSAVQKRHSKVYGNLIAPLFYSILLGHRYSYLSRGRKRHVCVSVPKECVSVYCTKGLYGRFIQYVRISGFVQSRRVHLFIVNCLLKHMFNIHVIYYLHI